LQERREPRRRFLAQALTVALMLAAPALLRAAPPRTAAPAPAALPVTFEGDVAPVLARWCVSCHGAKEQEGGLRLDSYLALLRGGDTGPAIVAGDPGGSLLVAKIERRDRPPMPPRRRLPAPLVARLRAWIAAGAPPARDAGAAGQ
jgi:mono/diheme cytochrome c family protein